MNQDAQMLSLSFNLGEVRVQGMIIEGTDSKIQYLCFLKQLKKVGDCLYPYSSVYDNIRWSKFEFFS